MAEGTVQWDTHKRLFNFLDRYSDRKRPVAIDTWGDANLKVAVSLGRIIRERGLDTIVGVTRPKQCARDNEPACFAKKRSATTALDAALDVNIVQCDLTCVMMFAGGVNRTMAAATKVLITGMAVHNRFGAHVPELHQENLTAIYTEQFHRYFIDMGIDPAILDLMKQSTESSRRIELPPRDWWRLRLVTESPL